MLMIILPVASFLVGFGMFAGSIGFGFRRRSFLKTASEATGTVLETGESVNHDFDSGHQTWYRPTVRFQTAAGQMIDYTSSVSTKTRYTVGQQILINYVPNNPQSVTFGSRKSFLTWLPFIFVGGIGIFFILLSLVFGLIVIAGF